MKIKFLKPFRLYNPIGDDMMMNEGAVENMEKEDYAQWLIDNGFAEEVKESGWWRPKNGDRYYFIDGSGYIKYDTWRNGFWDVDRYKMGNVFKTEEATKRCRAYLEAIATVRQDEGFMPNVPKRSYVWVIGYNDAGVIAPMETARGYAGSFRFYAYSQARDSLDKHPSEWQTILDYDWGKGEEEEDEDED